MTPLILALALIAQAPAVDRAGGKSAFDRAMGRFEVGAFEEALVDFVQAYELTGHHAILFNIAQCHRNLGDRRRAIFFFQRYLEHPNPKDAEGVRLAIAELERQLERDAGREARRDRGAQDPLDGSGSARVLAQAETPTIATVVEASAPPPPPLVTDASDEEPLPLVERWWFWALLGAGAAAVAGGISAGVWAGVEAGRSNAPDDRIATFDYRDL